MKNFSLIVTFVFCAFAEAATSTNVRGDGRKLQEHDHPPLGGYSTVTNFNDDPMTVEAAKFVLSSLQQQDSTNSNSMPYEFFGTTKAKAITTYQIIEVSQQVVAGMNIKLTMLFQDDESNCVGACNVVVYNHFGEMSVTSWNKQISCEEAETRLAEEKLAGTESDNTVVVLEDFSNPVHTWTEMNDPVMGGKSTGTFSIQDGLGKFVGEVVDVPFLHAPGFIKGQTSDHKVYPDITSCQALQIIAKSNTEYTGYRISFGKAHAPGGKFFAFGYKANLDVVSTTGDDDFGKVTIPFSQFTDFWDDSTGDPIHTCQEDPRFCPDEMTLKNIKVLEIWGEGVGGFVDLEIQRIQAVGCNDSI
jgi:hypothetical protein